MRSGSFGASGAILGSFLASSASTFDLYAKNAGPIPLSVQSDYEYKERQGLCSQ